MIAYENGVPVPTSSPDIGMEGRDGESDLQAFCAKFGLNEEDATDILQWADANHATPAVTLDTMRSLEARERMAWHVLATYQKRQGNATELRMSTRAMAFLLGHYGAAGGTVAADVAFCAGVTKQAFNKCVVHFQKGMRLPNSTGQRDAAGRKSMKKSRVKKCQPL